MKHATYIYKNIHIFYADKYIHFYEMYVTSGSACDAKQFITIILL